MPSPGKRVMVITARAGSKRAANKNFTPITEDGDSLCRLAEKFCLAVKERASGSVPAEIDKIILSTDKEDYTPMQGVILDKRPAHLATDSATSVAVLEDLMRREHFSVDDTMILVQPTSPFRNMTHLFKMITAAETDRDNRAVISCNRWRVRLDTVMAWPTDDPLQECAYEKKPCFTPNGNLYVLPPMPAGADANHIDQYQERLGGYGVLAFEQKSPLLNIDVDTPDDLQMVSALLGKFNPLRAED